MSGSYQQLLQKYNQLLALVLNMSGGTLQSVINADDELQGVAPTTNQVMKYNGTNVVWGTDAGTQNLNQVLTEGNTTTNTAIFQVGSDDTAIGYDGLQTQTVDDITVLRPDSLDMANSTGSKSIFIRNFSFSNPIITVKQSATTSSTIEGNKVQLSSAPVGFQNSIILDNVSGLAPGIEVIQLDTGTGITNATVVKNDSLAFLFGKQIVTLM
jgi:hypothetical protein